MYSWSHVKYSPLTSSHLQIQQWVDEKLFFLQWTQHTCALLCVNIAFWTDFYSPHVFNQFINYDFCIHVARFSWHFWEIVLRSNLTMAIENKNIDKSHLTVVFSVYCIFHPEHAHYLNTQPIRLHISTLSICLYMLIFKHF